MKKHFRQNVWPVLIVMVVLLCAVSVVYAHTIVISDPEADLGLILSPDTGDCKMHGYREAVILNPEKLTLLGLGHISKGEKVRLSHQVMNLVRIAHPKSGGVIKVRLKAKPGEAKWPFPNCL